MIWLLPRRWRDEVEATEAEIDEREEKVDSLESRLAKKRRDNGFGKMFGEAGLAPGHYKRRH